MIGSTNHLDRLDPGIAVGVVLHYTVAYVANQGTHMCTAETSFAL